jgi:methionyl-tRNA formyltransferase
LSDEEKTGTTLYLMDAKMDNGAILANSELRIQNSKWNYESLMKKLAELSGDLLIEILPKFIDGKITPLPQDSSKATFTKKFATEDGFVDLEKDNPIEIERKVRALNPDPGVWTMKDGKRMKILEAELDDNKLILKKIQFEGKKPQILI